MTSWLWQNGRKKHAREFCGKIRTLLGCSLAESLVSLVMKHPSRCWFHVTPQFFDFFGHAAEPRILSMSMNMKKPLCDRGKMCLGESKRITGWRPVHCYRNELVVRISDCTSVGQSHTLKIFEVFLVRWATLNFRFDCSARGTSRKVYRISLSWSPQGLFGDPGWVGCSSGHFRICMHCGWCLTRCNIHTIASSAWSVCKDVPKRWVCFLKWVAMRKLS